MDSGLIRKAEKAKDYAVQPDRVKFTRYDAEFRGDNGDHTISYEAGRWVCSCEFFAGLGTCSLTMAMQMMFVGMVSRVPVASA